MPDVSEAVATAAFSSSLSLHRLLNSMQAENSGLQTDQGAVTHEAVNRLIAASAVQPHISGDGTLSLTSDHSSEPTVRLLLVMLESVRAGVWHRFKLCYEPTCRASYYDASKATKQRWCSMERCGSRSKMRRYRAQRHVDQASVIPETVVERNVD